MSELVDWINARLDDDESWALTSERHDDVGAFSRDNYGCLLVDPARVLAEVNAKRAIVAKYVRASEAFDQMINPATSAAVMVLTEVVESLASVWVDAPGFREEWRP